MSFWKFPAGQARGTITSAQPGDTIQLIAGCGIKLNQVQWVDDLTVTFLFSRRDKPVIAQICARRGDNVTFSEENGISALIRRFFHRPILLSGCALLLMLTLYLPTRVFFFRVDGNTSVPAGQILETAQACGIRFGVSRKTVRSEKMKNALLEAMPELKWAGINTAGCTAVISVREGEIQQNKTTLPGISSIMAVRDGYVTSCTVTRGTALCVPGQVVRQGEILISGYTDLGICIQVTQAAGEIQAETVRKIRAVTPSEQLLRVKPQDIIRRFSLVLGKKRINLWKGSGISPVTCGRMYEEYYITLPGGFRLPACLAVETLTVWDTQVAEVPPETASTGLSDFAQASVLDQMIAGSILREKLKPEHKDGVYSLDGYFLCSEMIGRVITEEIGDTNGKIS